MKIRSHYLFLFFATFLGILPALESRAATYYIDPSEFKAVNDTPCALEQAHLGSYRGTLQASGSQCVAQAPFRVPSGTSVTGLEAYVQDSAASTTCQVKVELKYGSFGGATSSTSKTGTSISSESETLSLITSAAPLSLSTIRGYFIQVTIDPDTLTYPCEFKGLKLTY